MPHWLVVALLIVFAIHCVVFASLFLLRKDKYFVLVSLTFFLLVVSYSLRIWFETWQLAGLKAFFLLRVMAWAMALASISIAIRRRILLRQGRGTSRISP
jgi:hypothetical protein